MGALTMSLDLEPSPVLRICSCLTAVPTLLPRVESALEREFGAIILKSPSYLFDTSDYYEAEMGHDLKRYWYCFSELYAAESLPEFRRASGDIEERFSDKGRRGVNLDPGYLDHGKLVLASSKEAPDKVYLGRGVWAHVCLKFRSGQFIAPDHSFPDFSDGRFDAFMLEARALYKSLSASAR
jgi:hypothetical protein